MEIIFSDIIFESPNENVALSPLSTDSKQPISTPTSPEKKPIELTFINENLAAAAAATAHPSCHDRHKKPDNPSPPPPVDKITEPKPKSKTRTRTRTRTKKLEKRKVTRYTKRRKQEVKMILQRRPHFTKEVAEMVVYRVDQATSLQADNARDELVLTDDTDSDWDEVRIRKDRGLVSVDEIDDLIP